MTDCLRQYLTVWLIDNSDWLTDWLREMGWFTCWLRVTDWLPDQLIDRLTEWMNEWWKRRWKEVGVELGEWVRAWLINWLSHPVSILHLCHAYLGLTGKFSHPSQNNCKNFEPKKRLLWQTCVWWPPLFKENWKFIRKPDMLLNARIS